MSVRLSGSGLPSLGWVGEEDGAGSYFCASKPLGSEEVDKAEDSTHMVAMSPVSPFAATLGSFRGFFVPLPSFASPRSSILRRKSSVFPPPARANPLHPPPARTLRPPDLHPRRPRPRPTAHSQLACGIEQRRISRRLGTDRYPGKAKVQGGSDVGGTLEWSRFGRIPKVFAREASALHLQYTKCGSSAFCQDKASLQIFREARILQRYLKTWSRRAMRSSSPSRSKRQSPVERGDLSTDWWSTGQKRAPKRRGSPSAND
eukprot:scaffold748_cov251-Pinguiococcus_pyrenoidosus.AAC.13